MEHQTDVNELFRFRLLFMNLPWICTKYSLAEYMLKISSVICKYNVEKLGAEMGERADFIHLLWFYELKVFGSLQRFKDLHILFSSRFGVSDFIDFLRGFSATIE